VTRPPIIIVSGLPRSGTSMMMSILEAGGLEVLTDQHRTADEDNPRGYYELEAVKGLEWDASCLEEAPGKAVKIISALLPHLPTRWPYQVIFMHRHLDEVLASQRQMLRRRTGGTAPGGGAPGFSVAPERIIVNEEVAQGLVQHLARVEGWLEAQPNVQLIYMAYLEVIRDTSRAVTRVAQFLNRDLDLEKMAGVVDPGLHRHRYGSPLGPRGGGTGD